ncbi:prolyl aminopeptidase [Saccharobesus litoralis]|nr:prolyl aminopeptidase [Saccharobesus litoralis]
MVYPQIKPNDTEWLNVGDGHEIYIEHSGNPDGLPVIYIHGGPGGGSSPIYRSLFDPTIYRIIQFDQRGCGQSKPLLSLQNNNTASLIADIERIRQHLAIDKWLVCGGSWGTTLALLYALQHTERVSGMILRGIFLARQQDIDWLYGDAGAARLFPDYYQQFQQPIANDNRSPIQAYWPLLNSDNQLQQLNAARQWSLWEYRISRLTFAQSTEAELVEPHLCLPMALLECHYFLNHSFIEENYILNNIGKLNAIPATVIHGRYDAVCDVGQAWQLAEKWQSCKLMIVPEAGHSIAEPQIAAAFCQATRAMAKYMQEQGC